MGLLSGIVGKVVAGIVALAVMLVGISWWQADPDTRAAVIDGAGRLLGWIAIVAVVPWAGFLLIGWVARMQSNAAGAVLVAALTLIESAALLWLFDFRLPGAAAWSLAIAAMLIAAVYNLFACDWIAERVES